MEKALWLLLFFGLAATADWLTLAWHKARERGAVVPTVGLSALLESLTWLPVWFAISYRNYWIAVVSITGSALGTFLGMKRSTTKGKPTG